MIQLGKVAVIEDEDSVRKLLASVIEDGGFEVVSFDDAGPALEEIDFGDVDVVVTDLEMPTRGETAIQAIRSSGHSLPIVVLSGFIKQGEEKALLAIGATRILRKPFNMQVLLDTIFEVLPDGLE